MEGSRPPSSPCQPKPEICLPPSPLVIKYQKFAHYPPPLVRSKIVLHQHLISKIHILRRKYAYEIINRPGVAGAVLQTALSLIHYFVNSLID